MITDTFNHCIRLVDPTGTQIITVAGVCGSAGNVYGGDGGPALEGLIQEPGGSVMRIDGTIYIADTLGHRIRRVNPPLVPYFQ